ncbi:MAG: M14 family zinc carboxypeptidase [Candidatus Saccharicenans sp.]|nr:MAG: DUF2817 domain-containing protein [Candidatus Aminicenantes bacterium]HEK84939.1 DUF2817 domain-containing protein [Candidatus Aminicenantes bacterium]
MNLSRKLYFLISSLIWGLILNSFLFSASPRIKTPAEETQYRRYTQYEDIVRFLSLAQSTSKQVKIKTIGRTREVDNYPSRELFLVVLTDEGRLEPNELNRDKPTILVVASQHGNEQSGKEAALKLIGEAANANLQPLLKKVNLLIIPQANPYGNFFDVRENEIDLDLNRDHVKLEGESTRAIHHVFNLYQPEVTIDVHEKGDDYYRVSIGCVSNLNINRSLQDYSRDVILKEIEKKLEKKNITFHEYLVSETLGLDTSSGARITQPANKEIMLRYSTTDLNDGRNSLGIYETLSFIQEGASRHDLETLEARTNWQYAGIRALIETVSERPEEITRIVHQLRTQLIKRAAARAADDPVHLRMEYVRDPQQSEIVLKAFEVIPTPIRGILKVDKKAGDYLYSQDLIPYRGPANQKIVTRVEKNWFPLVESRLTVRRPSGYLIPSGRLEIVELLLQHGIKVQMLEKDASVEVVAYKITDIVPASADYLAPERIEVQPEKIKALFKKGDFFVSCLQPAANLIPCLLEPQSEYGLIRYFKFRLVPEIKDYFAIYRLEEPASWPLIDFENWSY